MRNEEIRKFAKVVRILAQFTPGTTEMILLYCRGALALGLLVPEREGARCLRHENFWRDGEEQNSADKLEKRRFKLEVWKQFQKVFPLVSLQGSTSSSAGSAVWQWTTTSPPRARPRSGSISSVSSICYPAGPLVLQSVVYCKICIAVPPLAVKISSQGGPFAVGKDYFVRYLHGKYLLLASLAYCVATEQLADLTKPV